MKTKVLDFLTDKNLPPQEQFNTALKLLIECNGSQSLIRSYSNRTYSAISLESLRYDLQKAAEISNSDLASHKTSTKTEEKKEERNPIILVGIADENKDLFTQLVAEMSAEEKEGYSLHAQYPFLREKTVPKEFKELINDKITAFVTYKEAHQELFDKVASLAEPQLTELEIYNLAATVVEEFLINQEIKKELDHYRDTKEILGDHEIFADLKLQREVDAIKPEKLQGIYNNLKSQISNTNKKPDSPEKTEKLNTLEDKKAKIFIKLYPGKPLPKKGEIEVVEKTPPKKATPKAAAKKSAALKPKTVEQA